MASHFYRLRMGRYAETVVRRSKRDTQERMWLQFHLMRLGNEIARSEHWTSLADQSVRRGIEANEGVVVNSIRDSRTILLNAPGIDVVHQADGPRTCDRSVGLRSHPHLADLRTSRREAEEGGGASPVDPILAQTS